jgi:HD-GYP domain-containing protein (c-di-GMP phosphodiesterase class II)
MSADHLKAISIAQLKVGMFVTKLDISWLDSPFLSHSRLIRQLDEIESLRAAGVKKLIIDLQRGSAPEPALEVPVAAKSAPAATLVAPGEPVKDAIAVPDKAAVKTDFAREMAAAVQLRGKIKKMVENVQRAFEVEAPVQVVDLIPLVDATLQSLARNDQALMSLVHLSRKSQKIADHVFGSFCLVLNLALVRQVSEREREELALAALLHEAGWVQLPINLLGKRTRYTKNELKLVHQHTQIGDRILRRSELPELTRRLVAEHHELLDGSGYPRGLKGAELHPLGQLLSVVDAYEERVHQLCDEPGLTPTNALRSLYKDAERGAFSPEVVAAFIGMLGIYPTTSLVQLNTGEKALVKLHDTDAPLLPRILVVVDVEGNLMQPPLEVDLRHQSGDLPRTIECALDPHTSAGELLRRLPSLEDLLDA